MREPIEVIERLRSEELSKEWVDKLYDDPEYTFVISVGGSINNPKKETSYTKKLEDLSEHEIKFLIENWLSKFDDRPKQG